MNTEGRLDSRLPARQQTLASRRKFLGILLASSLIAACKEPTKPIQTVAINTPAAIGPVPAETAKPLPTAKPTETRVPTQTAAPMLTATSRPTETPKPTATPKPADAPVSVEIYDSGYVKSEVLVQNLIRPGAVAIDSVDNSVYFVQKENNSGSRAESIFQFNGKNPVPKFRGAGDPWGQSHQTAIAINSDRTLFIYSRTYLADRLTTWDLATGNPLSEKTAPFANLLNNPNYNDKFQAVRGNSINPANDRFYMLAFEGPPLVSTGPSDVDLRPESPKNLPTIASSLSFDKAGNGFIGDYFSEDLIRIPTGGEGTKFPLRRLHESIKDMAETPGKFSVTGLAYDFYNDRLLIAGTNRSSQPKGTDFAKLVLSTNIRTGEVSPVAKVRSSYSLNIGGLAVSPKTGDIFITTQTGALPVHTDNGRLIRLERK